MLMESCYSYSKVGSHEKKSGVDRVLKMVIWICNEYFEHFSFERHKNTRNLNQSQMKMLHFDFLHVAWSELKEKLEAG